MIGGKKGEEYEYLEAKQKCTEVRKDAATWGTKLQVCENGNKKRGKTSGSYDKGWERQGRDGVKLS